MRHGDGRAGCLWRQVGRRHRNIEDVVPVHVFDRIEMSDNAIDTSSGDDRDLASQRDERFEDGFLTSKRLPRAGHAHILRSLHMAPIGGVSVAAS